MAKDKAAETVEVPVETLRLMQERLAALELQQATHASAAVAGRANVLDQSYEAWKAEASRPACERTQDIADKRYGGDAPRFRVHIDPTAEDGKKGPNISEHFPLTISANSDLEAQARYLQLMGIKSHSYRLVAELVA